MHPLPSIHSLTAIGRGTRNTVSPELQLPTVGVQPLGHRHLGQLLQLHRFGQLMRDDLFEGTGLNLFKDSLFLEEIIEQ